MTSAENRSALSIELGTDSTLAFDDTLYVDIRPALSGLVKPSSDVYKVHVGWTQSKQTAPREWSSDDEGVVLGDHI